MLQFKENQPAAWFHNMAFRLITTVLTIFMCGCATHKGENMPPSQLDEDVRSAERADLDNSAERKSEAMQRFLMAELSLDAERNDDALADLRASSQLLSTPDPQIQINIAQLYIGKGDLKSALTELGPVPEDPEAQALHAAILQSLGRWAEAVDSYRNILKINPNNTEARLMLSLDALQRKQDNESLALLEPVIAKEAKNLPALKLLIFSYRNLGNTQKALSNLDQVRQLDPGDLMAFETVLSIGLENRNDEIVDRELAREAKLNPESPILNGLQRINWKDLKSPQRQELEDTLHANTKVPPNANELRYQMARYELLKQNFTEAVKHFSLLLAAKPKDDELRYTLALALSSSGRVKEATATLETISNKSQWFVRSQAFAGILYRQRGDYRRAEQAFREALSSDPKSEQLQNYLASVLRESKKYADAKKVYQDILEQDPANQKTLFNYAVLLSDMGQNQESLEVMQKLVGFNPQHAEALNFISYALAEEGHDLDRALDLANRALQLHPENGFFLDSRGWVYFKMGRTKEALADLEKAVELTKGDAEIGEHLADVYLSAGRQKEALQVYKDALDNIVDSKEEADKVSGERIRKKIEEISDSQDHKNHQ